LRDAYVGRRSLAIRNHRRRSSSLVCAASERTSRAKMLARA
jgi:hypothetical protein